MDKLSHYDEAGQAHMVDVSAKTATRREAVAGAFVELSEAVGKPGLTRVLPARLTSDLERPTVRLVDWKGSGDLAANARANCYAVLPPDRERFVVGDVITILLR